MVISTAPFEPRERLRIMTRALQELHRTLLEYQRREYEKHFGRIGSDFYVLQLAAEDAEFAWLRALSNEMIRIDTAIGGKEAITAADLRLAGERVRYLLTPDASGNSFQSHYDRAMQTNPDIIMAHAQAMRSLPIARETRVFRSDPATDIRTYDAAPGFEAHVHHPGEMLPGHGDHGYRALAVIAECFLAPGTVIPMHRHANEDVLSLVPHGELRKKDAAGNTYVLDSRTFMLMNAGSGLEHAEETPENAAPMRMLQVYARPASLQGEPDIHTVEMPDLTPNQWRTLAGPVGEDAPAHVRNNLWIMDALIGVGEKIALPRRDGWDTVFFVFHGEVMIDDVPFFTSRSGLLPSPGEVTMRAVSRSRVVAFLVDPAAKVTRAGTFGQ